MSSSQPVNAYTNQASRHAPGQQAGGSVGVDSWPEQLAVRLFALPARWGWQAALESAAAAPSITPVGPAPAPVGGAAREGPQIS